MRRVVDKIAAGIQFVAERLLLNIDNERNIAMPAKTILIGTVFGRLKILGVAEPQLQKSGKFRSRSQCLCECGTVLTVLNYQLNGGVTQSCGCLCRERSREKHRKHGHASIDSQHRPSRTYRCWQDMWKRCTCPATVGFYLYGGRGITVCEQWKKFENFLADMGEVPEQLTLDRKDPNGNYDKSNCRWVTRKEQNINKRSNRILTVGGVTAPLSVLCEKFKLKYKKIISRLNRGWSVERAFSL